MTTETLPHTITRQLGAFGIECGAVDLSLGAALPGAVAAALRSDLHKHGVVLIRGQQLSPEQQIAITETCFGPVLPHPLRSRSAIAGDRVLVVENGGASAQRGARNDFWHSDISNVEHPPLVSVLHALDVPSGKGDTLFVDMRHCLTACCPPKLQASLRTLSAVHSSANLQRRNAEANSGNPIRSPPPPVVHPVVRRHPVSRPSLPVRLVV
jgi:alpha-ketoglutarate-dependent taurine dioxygenase